MLKSLEVKDYALIEHVTVQFGKGLNIITGETGAGKSILIDAMGLLLGERASSEVVRKGAAKSVIEGIFDASLNPKVETFLTENDIDPSPELIVRREISVKGANRCFINDTPVPLGSIKEIGNFLVDLHGQHEHQSLLRTDTHIEFLDEVGSAGELLSEFKDLYAGLNSKIRQLKELREKENLLKEKKDLYEFQIKEIDAVNPEEGEEDRLLEELKILENSEKLLESTAAVYQSLYDSENAVYDSLVKIKNEFEVLVKIDKSFNEAAAELKSALALIDDIAASVRQYNDKIDLDPKRLEEIRERLGMLSHLKKKYGGTVERVLEHRNKIGAEYEAAVNYSGSIKKIDDEISRFRELCGDAAARLSKQRKQLVPKITTGVKEVLSSLGIADAVFEIRISNERADRIEENYVLIKGEKYRINNRGIDDVEFFISTNAGEELKPLAKVASGGEVSRIMLSLKTVLANKDKLPLLIFDEIDTGVSGRVARKVGGALKTLSQRHQIIAITHLPQIAGLADTHFMVEKSPSGGRVISSIRKLTDEERVREVAKLMSGEEVTESSLRGARELTGL